MQPQNLRFNEEAAPTVRDSPTYGPAHVAAGNQHEDVAGDPPRDYSGFGSAAAEPPAADDPGYEGERDGDKDDDEWFTPHQENTKRRSSHRHHANADYQGSHSADRVKDDLIVKALKAIVNRQDLPSKPPMGNMPTFGDSYRTFPCFHKDVEAFLGDFYTCASERTHVSEIKQKCFSAQTLRKVENCETVSAIMEILAECYCRPDRFVDEVLELIRATRESNSIC